MISFEIVSKLSGSELRDDILRKQNNNSKLPIFYYLIFNKYLIFAGQAKYRVQQKEDTTTNPFNFK